MTERRFILEEFDDYAFPPATREADNGAMILRGYASVFDLPSQPLWYWDDDAEEDVSFVEYIAPGAFTRTLRAKDDVVALFNHDNNRLLARSSSGTLKLTEDRYGLLCEIHVVANYVGKATYEWVRRRDVSKMSFAFQVVRDRWEYRGEQKVCTVLEAKLIDVSPVVHPAYELTAIDIAGLANSAVERLAQRYKVETISDSAMELIRMRQRLAEKA